MNEAYELFGCNTADLFVIGINTSGSNNNANVLQYYQNLGLQFSALSGVEGGGNAIGNTYQLTYVPTYILIAPDHSIVEQDIWPVNNTQTFINTFESNGVEQASCDVTLAAGFTADDWSVCEGSTVQFTDESTGNITSWEWTFEDGDPPTSTEQNPQVYYANEGDKDVTLTVSDGTNEDTAGGLDIMLIFPLPEVSLQTFADVCVDWPAFELTGGEPAGGEYSGTGVSNGFFDPSVAGLGTFEITYTYADNNGCEDFAMQTIYVDACTGLDETADGKMSIYPNPTNGNFELRIDYSGMVSVKVINMLGVTVYKEKTVATGNFTKSFDLNGMEDGIYFVSIQTNEKTYVKKLKLQSN
ncbi:MAG: hypothetical protein B6D61_06520 [Bacteroidetes bacterium 4484_249]|nr:MAG: hypothetical protein B6D61_06520 [Bacteroidetes bacterium 4484_249]